VINNDEEDGDHNSSAIELESPTQNLDVSHSVSSDSENNKGEKEKGDEE